MAQDTGPDAAGNGAGNSGAQPDTGGSAASDNTDTDQRFRILMLAHAMSVDARLTRIEAGLAELRLTTAEAVIKDEIAGLPEDKDKGGRPRDDYLDFLAALNTAQIEAAKLAKQEVLKGCPDIPPEHVERVLLAFLGAFYDVQTTGVRAHAEERYRTERGSTNPKAALSKALQRRRT
jgi:hypothetical protein